MLDLRFFEESDFNLSPNQPQKLLACSLLKGLEVEYYETISLDHPPQVPECAFSPVACKIAFWYPRRYLAGEGSIAVMSIIGAEGEHAEAALAKKLDIATSRLPGERRIKKLPPQVVFERMLGEWDFGQEVLEKIRRMSPEELQNLDATVGLGAIAIAEKEPQSETAVFQYRPQLDPAGVAHLLRKAPPELS